MGILRLGYLHVRVTDMAEARQHYVETMGLKVIAEEEGKGAVALDGKMIDAPIINSAKRILRLAAVSGVRR